MPETAFNRDEMALWYARRHLKTDPGIQVVFYLPTGAPEREIRFIEINDLIADRNGNPLEPIDFGVDIGGADRHTLMILDVTPAQWNLINQNRLQLPDGWSMEDAVPFAR
jgi:hypothetical protein